MNTWPKGKPFGKKKALYIAIMFNMKVLESVVVEDRTYHNIKQVWVNRVEFHTNYKFTIESLGERIQRITRIR